MHALVNTLEVMVYIAEIKREHRDTEEGPQRELNSKFFVGLRKSLFLFGDKQSKRERECVSLLYFILFINCLLKNNKTKN